MHCFHQGATNLGNQLEVLVQNADPSKLGRSLLEGNQDHLLNQARSELKKQGHQVGSLNRCINELQQQDNAQRLELQDAQHGYIESRQEQVRLQEELSMKEKVLRETQIRSIHEMGQMKRAQELRVDEFSVQKLRESHETIQRLTSQLQEMYEQMNSVNDSGEFQEVESNHSGRLSYVSSQPAMIPSSRSMLSRDKRLPLDTWNQTGLQGNDVLKRCVRVASTHGDVLNVHTQAFLNAHTRGSLSLSTLLLFLFLSIGRFALPKKAVHLQPS